ncbi:MAG: hypothetical protein ALAOOOJD_01898 [bacterium]|nr:hypothetical protein [bacterium]
MNHRQLEVRGGIVDGQPTGLREHNDKQRGKSEQMTGIDHRCWISQRVQHNAAEVGGAGAQREAKDGERNRRLGNRGHGHFTAGAHAAECGAGIETGQRQEKRSQEQQINDGDQIADIVKRQGRRDQRNEERHRDGAAENDVRREAEEPRGVIRHHHFLAEQFAQLKIRLPRRCAAAILQPRFQPADQSHQARREHQGQQNLCEFENIAGHVF